MGLLTTVLELSGLALIVAGVAVIFWPAGLIVAGGAALLLGVLLAPTGAPPAEDGE